jgi:hypothetical protein
VPVEHVEYVLVPVLMVLDYVKAEYYVEEYLAIKENVFNKKFIYQLL